ncbi:FixH family protein [Massilia sp. TS11]|uniref:FixH family protein n=1 Tax=Massilia sp. TS11 TaxID=2908003 RepID=UPI001EDA29BC|nr:FixH family protein [Massilia sp. TS11]MCG2583997.1 FixH family protein [Massilia sp. TS11]
MNTTTLNSARDDGPWYTHRWPWLLMLGPGVVVAAGGYMSYLAYKNQDALVVGDYYKQGKAINQDLRRDKEASRLGLAVELAVDVADARLSGRLLSHGQPLQGALQLHLAHATQPEKDIQLFVKTDADGRFSLNLPPLAPSRWQVTLSDTANQWRLEGPWQYPKVATLQLAADKL